MTKSKQALNDESASPNCAAYCNSASQWLGIKLSTWEFECSIMLQK